MVQGFRASLESNLNDRGPELQVCGISSKGTASMGSDIESVRGGHIEGITKVAPRTVVVGTAGE